ncbi:outer membrane beta-barrel protein [Eudoraea chungangensis]|uniref:outer membrane beta-barrel protein n=1 Tax=Eudoraea chungangensis TaxID=1481905 RepID=UPI0023ED81B3|nr:outer membrane beta-barrel protein [Eudoraea chungangensis]
MKSFTNTSYIKNLFLLAVLILASSAFAQEEEEEKKMTFNFSGSVDAYYRTNFNGLNSKVPVIENGVEIGEIEPSAPGTSFANDHGFSIGMANLILGYEGEKVGFVADLVFGPRGEDAVFNDIGSTNIVNQLYVYWNVSEKVTLTFGNFNTFLGYEVISPVANFNYSTSYMFSYGPFSHAGLKADFDLGNDWSAMVAILNQTDFTSSARVSDFSFGAQIGYAGQYLNFLYGKQGIDKVLIDGNIVEPSISGLFQIDYTGGFNFGEDFFLGINATYQDTGDVGFDEFTPDDLGFYGVALYPQYTTSETFTIGLRGEYFSEIGDYGAIGTGVEDSNVFALTATGNIQLGNLAIKPEIRFDTASDDAFLNSDLVAQDNLSSFLLAAVYAF